MMSSSLKLSGAPTPLERAVEQQQARRVQELEQQLRRQRELLTSVGRTMADGGDKVSDIYSPGR